MTTTRERALEAALRLYMIPGEAKRMLSADPLLRQRQRFDQATAALALPPSPQPAPVACAHEYIEAKNYGQDRDNVECRKCGQLWLRLDRATGGDATTAPDMLAALRAIITIYDTGRGIESCRTEINAARAAIARATGREG